MPAVVAAAAASADDLPRPSFTISKPKVGGFLNTLSDPVANRQRVALSLGGFSERAPQLVGPSLHFFSTRTVGPSLKFSSTTRCPFGTVKQPCAAAVSPNQRHHFHIKTNPHRRGNRLRRPALCALQPRCWRLSPP
jgi:hypothetical protein